MLDKRLRSLRKDVDLTQKELCLRLSIKRDTYSQYEMGRRRPDYETLGKLADFYNCSVDYLLGRTDIRDRFPDAAIKESPYGINRK